MKREHVAVCPARFRPSPDYPCVCLQVEEALAHVDQQPKLKPRELAARWVLWSGIALYVAAGLYGVAAALGWLPAAPWSALGTQ